MKSEILRVCLAAVLVAVVSAPAFAQPARGVVSGSGVVTIRKQPQVMRMRIQLLAKASTLKKALDVLKDRVTAARSQVVVLGAEKSSIKVGRPELSTGQTDMQKMMQQMMQKRMRRALSKRKKPVSVPVTVTATLTAEWKLTAKDARELLLAAHPLQNKIRAVDIAGAKEAGKRSPQEQEIFEEMKNRFGGGGDESKPGDPVFLFVGRVSESERDKALAEAFKKAKAKAARLANAAGSELGQLQSLASQSDNGAADDSDSSAYGYYAMLQGARNIAKQEEKDPPEAFGKKPGLVTYRIRVTASFDLKSK